MIRPTGRSTIAFAGLLFTAISCSSGPPSEQGVPAGSAPPPGGTGSSGSSSGASGGIEAGAPDAPATDPGVFVPAKKNVPMGALCNIPPDYVAKGGDTTNIPCDVAADSLSDRNPSTVPSTLRVVAWNVEFGKQSAAVLDALAKQPELAGDFLLLSEVPRASKTSTPSDIDLAREIATRMKLNYLFAVEWDRRDVPAELGEHGVAVLSKYPLGNVTQIRHPALNDWYAQDKLYGGRLTLGADALVGGKRMRVYASHLCTRGAGDAGRAMQAEGIRKDADLAGRPALELVGGDLNTWTCNPNVADCSKAPAAEKVVKDFLGAGWSDGTEGWNGITQIGKGFFPQRLDWLFYRGAKAVPGHRAESDASDHKPIYFQVSPP